MYQDKICLGMCEDMPCKSSCSQKASHTKINIVHPNKQKRNRSSNRHCKRFSVYRPILKNDIILANVLMRHRVRFFRLHAGIESTPYDT